MRRAALVALACVLTVALLAAVAPHHLEHWDEIQLELGMRRFDLGWHEPHPPGYVLFVLAGRAAGFITRAAHPGRVLTLLAVVAWIAMLARELGKKAALVLIAPILFLLSPTLLVHGSTGRTYVVESTLWVAALLLMRSRARFAPLAVGAVVGLAGGFRPTVMIWGAIAIVAMVVVRRRTLKARQLIQLLGAFTLGLVFWVAALAILCGGLDRYVELSAPLLRNNVFQKSIFVQGAASILRERLPLMLKSLWETLGPFLVVPALLFVRRLRHRAELRDLDGLLYGALIAFVFYLAMIFDSDGYSLSYVLPLVTWTLLTLGRTKVGPVFVTTALTATFVAWAFVPDGIARRSNALASRARLMATIDTRHAAIDTLPAESTLVVTGVENFAGWNFRLLMIERPARAVLQLAPDWFIPHITPAHPYMVARDKNLQASGPDGLDLASLPQFAAAPLRHVVFASPRESSARLHSSCAPFARPLITSRGESLPHLEVGPALRVFARGGKLFCVGSELPQPPVGGG